MRRLARGLQQLGPDRGKVLRLPRCKVQSGGRKRQEVSENPADMFAMIPRKGRQCAPSDPKLKPLLSPRFPPSPCLFSAPCQLAVVQLHVRGSAQHGVLRADASHAKRADDHDAMWNYGVRSRCVCSKDAHQLHARFLGRRVPLPLLGPPHRQAREALLHRPAEGNRGRVLGDRVRSPLQLHEGYARKWRMRRLQGR